MANLEWASDLAVELLDEYGTEITIRFYTPAPKPPGRPFDIVDPIENSIVTIGLFTQFRQEHIDGTLIKQEDRRVLVAGLNLRDSGIETRLNGHIELGSQKWQIIAVNQIAPDENTILFVFQVRK